MFNLKRETDYAVQLIQFLYGKKVKFSSLREFSKKSGISFWFLQKIARKLNLAGIIEAEQGVKGGYKLSAPAKELNLYKIFEAIEGKPFLTPCARGDGKCAGAGRKCAVKAISVKLCKDISKMLRKTKVIV